MKTFVLKSFDKILLVLLTCLGFGACESAVEYGAPHADFIIKGKVTDKETKRSIPNVRVIKESPGDRIYGDTIYTDQNGEYNYAFESYLFDEATLKVEDADGEENGGWFEPQEITIDSKDFQKIKNGEGWYEGTFSKVQDFELKKKQIQ
ncbi:MAG: radical SAM-associated putative lipoprotein [Dysgonamonadaceae bacterium]|jgi:putative lipoprotein (rSAM/lipoprotein system)|nr:radical SAM-associated putative lipoprotein [Dysgonamonadaceae bacterium]